MEPDGPEVLVPSLTDPEVERLAAGGAVVRDGLLGPRRAAAIRPALERYLPQLFPAGVGRGQARSAGVRSDAIAWLELDDEPALEPLGRAFDALAAEVARAAGLGLVRREVQLARYLPGGVGYGRHVDAFSQGPPGPRRRVTCLYYANPDWCPAHRGELRLWAPADGEEAARCVDVAPLLDRVVLFLSERLAHAVLPTEVPRWAVTAWYSG
jgi:SM-20-related protein